MNDSSSSGTLAIYRRLLAYVRPHVRAFIIAAFALGFVGLTEALFAMLIKPLIDGSFVQKDPMIVTLAPLALILLFLVRGVASYLSDFWMMWVARQVINTLRGQMFSRLLRLPVTFYDHTPSGTLLSKLTYDVEQVAMASSQVISILIRDTLTVIGLLAWMFYIDWVLALILLIGTPLIAWIIGVINKRFRRYSSRIQTSVGAINEIASEAIDGQRVVKTFGGQRYEDERFAAANEENRRLNMRMEATSAAAVPVIQWVAATAAAGVIFVATRDQNLQQLTAGTFVSFVASMMMLLAPMKRLAKVMSSLQRGVSAAESIFTLIDTPTEVDTGTLHIGRSRGRVEYRDVHFCYQAEKGDVLRGVSFTAEAGQTVAFVGRSGSGKSTLVSLLPRFYDLQQGSILLDGIDIRDIPLDELRDQISLVSQNITLFNDTIANNIAYGRMAGASREAIIAAAEAAQSMEFIREQPQGLDTMVGENGVLLSGGQRQRLAIARALLKNSPILILDEATSALDTQSERHIQSALEQLMKNRTTLVIAHRLSTIEGADKIIVMDKGQVVESGRHDELLRAGGHYAALHNMQFAD
ncbi:MAG TPA: lipid A export permease/ATP-binding protein MsbA [Gammaproteobacteria bacterium]